MARPVLKLWVLPAFSSVVPYALSVSSTVVYHAQFNRPRYFSYLSLRV